MLFSLFCIYYVTVQYLKNTDEVRFENDFEQVHKNIQTVSPLLLDKPYGTTINSIIPWAQKTLHTIDEGKLLKVFAYEADDDIYLLYFLYFDNEDSTSTNKEKTSLQLHEIKYGQSESNLLATYYDLNFEYDENLHSFGNYFFKNDYFYYYTIPFYEEVLVDNIPVNDNDEAINKFAYQLNSHIPPERIYEEEFPYAADYDVYFNHNNAHKISIDFDSSAVTLINEQDKKEPLFWPDQDAWSVGSFIWSDDNTKLFFDNHGSQAACIWQYHLKTRSLEKIIPEHEARDPFFFNYKNKEYILYIENNTIKAAIQSQIISP